MKRDGKRFRLRKMIACMAAAVCLVTFGATAVGCNEEEPEEIIDPQNCELILNSGVGWSDQYKDFITICNSYAEVEEAFTAHGVDTFSSDDVREYIDDHTEDKSLVVCFYLNSAYYGPEVLKEIEVHDGTLTMYIKCYVSGNAAHVAFSTIFIASVDKTFVEGVTNCTYKIN